MSCKDESFNPEVIDLGHLPEKPTGKIPQQYAIPEEIPAEAKSVLLYAFATTTDQCSFHRGFFQIFTKEGDITYAMYMNFATSTAATITSANVWLPITSDRTVYVNLYYPPDVSVAHKVKTPVPKGLQGMQAKLCGEDWSNLFITGWK
ncbi:uncharacterized protein LOC116299701 [Actinia tenebrosa]|uniref:Uncharacterized protein LOC116299701 n=1 Tax=Actinia tenebrosa TaxID=6105 RepID=A0A6P8I8A0_ACTTE|nr:uncharacterized protein LOC116299701 [Actinia tenebrosa]